MMVTSNVDSTYMMLIHDYLTYGKFVGWCVHGRLNYPICMDDSDAFTPEHGGKVTSFYCHQRFLPMNHPFRSDKQSFLEDKTVRKGAPKQKIGSDITKMLDGDVPALYKCS
jgi:hypothetical protein